MAMLKKINSNAESLNFGLLLVLLSMIVFVFAFISEENKTGFATLDTSSDLIVYNNVDSLSSLAPGNYYVDNNGVVYWLDDNSKPAIAKVQYLRDAQKNKYIHIDNNGNIVY